MKAWLKGALIGFVGFIIFFIILSWINTGEVDFVIAFLAQDPMVFINYLIILVFVLAGAIIGKRLDKRGKK